MAIRNEADGSLTITSNKNRRTSDMLTSSLASILAASSYLNNNSARALNSFTVPSENFFSDDCAQIANSKEVNRMISQTEID